MITKQDIIFENNGSINIIPSGTKIETNQEKRARIDSELDVIDTKMKANLERSALNRNDVKDTPIIRTKQSVNAPRYNTEFKNFLKNNFPKEFEDMTNMSKHIDIRGEQVPLMKMPNLTGDVDKDKKLAGDYMQNWFNACANRKVREHGLGD